MLHHPRTRSSSLLSPALWSPIRSMAALALALAAGDALAADAEPTSSTTTGYLAPAAAPPTATTRPRLAVAGFVAPGVPDEVVAALEGACATEVARLVKADVISAEDMRMLMNVSMYQATMGCESGDCLQSLGNALAVQQLVSGSVRKNGEGYTLSLSRLDAVNARVLQRTTVEVKDAAGLVKAVRQATPALFGVIGKLEVWDQPAGAEVFIDGAHTIEIVGPTVTPWRAAFELGAGDELKLRAKNRPIDQVEAESAAWTFAGVGLTVGGVAASAAAGAFYFLAVRNDQRADPVTLRSASQEELNSIADVTLGWTVASGAAAVVGVAALGGGVAALLFNPAAAELDAALE
jgi:hypothetical protein